MEGKSQLDKNCGDHKKPDAEKNNCRCACHSKANTTKATPAAGPAVVDLTQSPCKGKSEPATSAAEHGKHFSMSGVFFFWMRITLTEPTFCSAFFVPYFVPLCTIIIFLTRGSSKRDSSINLVVLF